MSKITDEKLADIVKWWDFNKRTATSLEQEHKLQRRLIENLFDLVTLMANDLRSLEKRPAEDLERALFTPGRMNWSGDLRKLG